MTDDATLPTPGEFKTQTDGRGGLIKVTLVGEPHDGRVLYMDELELPAELYTSGAGRPFEWWPPQVNDAMSRTAIGADPIAPPVHYRLRVPEDTGEPLYISDEQAR